MTNVIVSSKIYDKRDDFNYEIATGHNRTYILWRFSLLIQKNCLKT